MLGCNWAAWSTSDHLTKASSLLHPDKPNCRRQSELTILGRKSWRPWRPNPCHGEPADQEPQEEVPLVGPGDRERALVLEAVQRTEHLVGVAECRRVGESAVEHVGVEVAEGAIVPRL